MKITRNSQYHLELDDYELLVIRRALDSVSRNNLSFKDTEICKELSKQIGENSK